MDKKIWYVGYLITGFIHYVIFPAGWYGIITPTFNLDLGDLCTFLSLTAAFILFILLAGGLFNGCLFSHLQEYCLVRAGVKESVAYAFCDSLAYKTFYRFF